MNTQTTITVEGGNIFINSESLEALLEKVYNRGKQDALVLDKNEKISFIQLSKELKEKGRKLSVRTLANKAKTANVKIMAVDGKRTGVYRIDIKYFISC